MSESESSRYYRKCNTTLHGEPVLKVLFPEPQTEQDSLIVGEPAAAILRQVGKVTLTCTRYRLTAPAGSPPISPEEQYVEPQLELRSPFGNRTLTGWDLIDDGPGLVAKVEEQLDGHSCLTIILEHGIVEYPLPIHPPAAG